MRILVFGAGVLGGNLANNLYKSGKDVTLLARGAWGKEIRKNGLTIHHKLLFKKTNIPIPVVSELKPEDAYDVIFVVMRYTQLDAVIDILNANTTKNIVLVGNNIRAREYRDRMPEKNVMFAFALSAGHRDETSIESIDLKKITIGQLREDASNEALIAHIFAGTGYKVVYQPNMEDYLLCHAAFVIPVSFACYYSEGDLRRLTRANSYIDRVIEANREAYRAIEISGHSIIPESDNDYESDNYYKKTFLFFKAMCATRLGKICASDHAMCAMDEMGALNRDLKKVFDAAGIDYPMWKALEQHTNGYLEIS
ncbi:MAG: 2-dehydropantoate 2-reductase N-terminal domain-containing protein [bacterium]|nr:2-dehydropantoate 2-reductase N-terminal domain-containing protein [bacterium]